MPSSGHNCHQCGYCRLSSRAQCWSKCRWLLCCKREDIRASPAVEVMLCWENTLPGTDGQVGKIITEKTWSPLIRWLFRQILHLYSSGRRNENMKIHQEQERKPCYFWCFPVGSTQWRQLFTRYVVTQLEMY